jgi:hypothetical protein
MVCVRFARAVVLTVVDCRMGVQFRRKYAEQNRVNRTFDQVA